MNPHYEALGFYDILKKVKEYALSQRAHETLDGLEPILNEQRCIAKMREVTAARAVLDACGSPPLAAMKGLEEALSLSEAGAMLVPEQLLSVAQFAASCKRMASYLLRGESIHAEMGAYGRSIDGLTELREEIERCVGPEEVYSEASSELRSIRRKKEHTEAQIKERLSHILQSRKEYLADGYITTRNGRYVLPVKRQYQSRFGGTVIEVSGKGATVFMEPSAVAKLQEELTSLMVDEDHEVRRILYSLTANVADHAASITRNMQMMEELDVLFAKAKLSAAMRARAVAIGGGGRLVIDQGRHPLLNPDDCVPLDFELDESMRGAIITGPNTGGKTVAVKTVGLLSLMAQCGLHIPCGPNTTIAMRDSYLCDIGDSQSISQNLSTFSGHMTNVIRILESASPDSLVLLDELGSGTDPAEGMGIAVAVLEELRQRGCLFLATTHYEKVKAYAEQTEGVQSARMAFDPESLQPLYRLEMGKSGESCALHIAKKLGLPEHLLSRARHAVYGEGTENPQGNPKAMPIPKTRLVRMAPAKESHNPVEKFTMGDSVVLPEGETGIVYRSADENGEVIVQVKGEKRRVRHTRLTLRVAAAELYPPDYDFSVVFDTVENRKASKKLTKRHDPSVCVVYDAPMPKA